jgi:hypothetical protein
MVRTVRFLLMWALAGGCSRMDPESRDIEIETSEGTVHAKHSQVDSFPQKISTLEGDDLQQLAAIPPNDAFVKKYKPEITSPTLLDYDDAFLAWKSDMSGEYSDEDVVMIVGGYLGNRCIADFDMEWVRVEDEFGTDFAVRAKKSEVMIFPFSSVQKRIDNNEHAFVHGVYHALKDLLESGDYKPRDAEDSG